MVNQWNPEQLMNFTTGCPAGTPPPFIDQIYATRLLGADPALALHGGGNTSYKGTHPDLLGEQIETLFVKASGSDMATTGSADFVALDLKRLQRLNRNMELDDETMDAFFRTVKTQIQVRRPSIETLLHAFLPFTCIDHTHPDAILGLTNRNNADICIQQAFTIPVEVLPYATVGIHLAQSATAAIAAMPGCKGIIIGHHGLVTWGATAREAYDATVTIVTEAENWLKNKRSRSFNTVHDQSSVVRAKERYRAVAPLLRSCLSAPCGDAGHHPAISMLHIVDENILSLLDEPEVRRSIVSTPLTPDYIIRIKRLPLFIEDPAFDDPEKLRSQTMSACSAYVDAENAFINKHVADSATVVTDDNRLPRVLLIPGLGIVCAGPTVRDARIAADIMSHAFSVKQAILETGDVYRDLGDDHYGNMEYRSYQRAKLHPGTNGRIVLVTGAAGAIGSGLCIHLLEQGYQVALSDLPGKSLDEFASECAEKYGIDAVAAIPMDITDEASVQEGFGRIIDRFGGLDAVVVNAGIAHVATLATLELEAFKRLERVNIDGTLLTIREAGRLFALQKTGGDIILVSTKNVFAPGASFGAYSATKAAAHQIARIASLELAPINVRVNMVAPDAVFSHGGHKSGLWATVGPGRMKSRGLDEAGLEEYYRNRNLLKSKVTAVHVAAAVEFFLERRTPTTGATIPVDGGLPDATPR